MNKADAGKARKALLNRIRRVEGQLRGVQKLIEAGSDCALVAQQLAAARKALDGAFFELIACAMRGETSGPVAEESMRSQSIAADLLVKYG
jgi:DNA-binding FrmR family transcriptional regulator